MTSAGGRAAPRAAQRAGLDHVVVVLVEPGEPGNVGAVARVMWNVGAKELRLVVPQEKRRATLLGAEARARACDGLPLLERASCFADLRAALSGVRRACAFSARTGRFRQPRATLEEAAARIARERAGLAALVFGREDQCLYAQEVALAHEVVTIPAPGKCPVLNLSHAAAIALWEVVRASGAFAPLPEHRERPRIASVEERVALRDDVSRLLVELGLSPGEHGDLHGRIVRRFMDLFDRAGAEHADFSMFEGLFVAFRRRLEATRRGAAR